MAKAVVVMLLGLLLVAASGTSQLPSCKSRRETSSLAVSIAYAVCNGSVVMAAESIASATASRCSDTIAASIGVSVAYMAPTDNLDNAVTAAFSSALTLTNATDGGVAVAQSIALAIASATPSGLDPAAVMLKMIKSLAAAVTNMAAKLGCSAASKLAVAVLSTFNECGATDLGTQFSTALSQFMADLMAAASSEGGGGLEVSTVADLKGSGICNQMTNMTLAPPAWLVQKTTARGRISKLVFSDTYDSWKLSSTVAVNIAVASCPTGGNATLAAVAIATAYTSDGVATVDAIAAVLASGVNLTSIVNQTFSSVQMPGRANAIQAFAQTIVATTGDLQSTLMTAVSAAVNMVARMFGCEQAASDMTLLKAIIVDPIMYQSLCTIVVLCPQSC